MISMRKRVIRAHKYPNEHSLGLQAHETVKNEMKIGKIGI